MGSNWGPWTYPTSLEGVVEAEEYLEAVREAMLKNPGCTHLS